jgi:hypothetical protein
MPRKTETTTELLWSFLTLLCMAGSPPCTVLSSCYLRLVIILIAPVSLDTL